MATDFICGKTALITGGAKGLGAAFVKRLFKAGMKACTIGDTDEANGEKLVKEIEGCYGEGKAFFVKTDVTNQDSFECTFNQAIKNSQKLDLLINNAGILGDRIWEKEVDINAKSVVRGTFLGIKYMGKNNGGCGGTILNVASMLGLTIMPECPGYTGTKHFVIGFTRSMGSKLWFDITGIRFLMVCPGPTITPLTAAAEQAAFEGYPGLGKALDQALKSLPQQTADQMADGVNTMLNDGKNGSIWVGIGGEPVYEVAIPAIEDMKVSGCKR